MEREIRNSTMHNLLPLLAATLGIIPSLLADPVWEPAPQKKDILPNPKGSISYVEKADRYQISLEFPGRDLSKILINLKDGILHVEAPPDGSLPRVIRDIPIEGASRDGSLSIDRSVSGGLLLVTVPKEGADLLPARSLAKRAVIPAIIPVITQSSDSFADDEFAMMLSEMRRVEKAMTLMMGGFQGMHPSVSGGFPSKIAIPRVGTPSLEDAGDHYVVRVALPDKDLSKVNVNFKDGMLMIEASHEATANHSDNAYMSSSYQYSQAVNIPGPVLVGKMKVDRQGGELVVTLPKLKS